MASTLVINPGSTSKKYALFKDGVMVFSMSFEETGDGFGVCRAKNNEQQKCEALEAHTYKKAIEFFVAEAQRTGVVGTAQDITAVGIRIVAPGTLFTTHQKITDEYLAALEEAAAVAPLHIPVISGEIYAVKALLPHTVLYGISDSAFHTSMPAFRRKLAIPRADSEAYDLMRFGYHGISMASIVARNETFFGVAPDRTIIAHVGGGVSVTAVHYQESVDTSMGYSPASGVVMGSRAGMFDADALAGLITKKHITDASQLPIYLNKESGFKGLTGVSDMRVLLHRHSEGDRDACEALEMFRYQLHRQIGGHFATLGGLDALILTGTAMVRSEFLRAYVLIGLECFGLVLDTERNNALAGKEGMIHADRSEVSIAVMKNDEMGEIARSVEALRQKQ